MDMVETNEAILDRHLRPVLRDLVSRCTEPQQGKFEKIFGNVDTVPAEKIPSAIALCERTIKKNEGQ